MSTTGVSVELIRNATVVLDVGDTTFLVDPMFTPQAEMPTVTDLPSIPEFLTTANQRRNPLVPVPDVDLSPDAVAVTHRHADHWDEAAIKNLDADVPLFCQPEEAKEFTDEGFSDVRPVEDKTAFDGISIHRTPGRHGHAELAEGMAPVSGFVFNGEETVYVAGDTIWYEPVEATLNEFDPDLVILNGGEAQFDQGEPITMGVEDITAVRKATNAEIVVVHMEAINHCLLSREELRSATEDIHVLADDERLSL